MLRRRFPFRSPIQIPEKLPGQAEHSAGPDSFHFMKQQLNLIIFRTVDQIDLTYGNITGKI